MPIPVAGQAHAEPFLVPGGDVNAVIEGEADGGDHTGIGDLGFGEALSSLLYLVPLGDVGGADVAADLDVVEGHVGVGEVAADGLDQLEEAGFKGGSGANQFSRGQGGGLFSTY